MLQEEFDSHVLWTQIRKSVDHLDQLDKGAGADERAQLNRIRFIASYAMSFNAVPPELFNAQMLSMLNSAWEAVLLYLEQYVASPAGDALTQAVSSAETCVELLGRWPSRPLDEPKTAQITKLFRDFSRELEAARIRSEESLKEVIDLSKQEKDELKAQILDLDIAFRKSLSLVEHIEAKISDDEEKLRTALTANNEAFNASQTARELALTKWLSDQVQNFEKLADPHLLSIERANVQAEVAYQEISKLRDKTRNLASLTSGDILGEKYETSASQERWTGLIAYGAGFIVIGVGLAIYIHLFGGSNPASLSWKAITLKFGFSAAILGGAAIAFQVGKRSLHNSSAYKRVELELRAIGPFLADVENADETKTEYIKKSFGRSWDDSGKSTDSEAVTNNLMKAIPEIVLTALKGKS